MFNTKYHIKYNSIYTNSCYAFSLLHNLKLKSEVNNWLKIITKTELSFHVAEFSFQKPQYV